MSSNEAPRSMPFIIQNGSEQVNVETRKLIRSHVMLGKNLGKTLQVKRKRGARTKTPTQPNEDASATADLPEGVDYSSIPRMVGTDLSLTRFADDIDPSLVAGIIKFSSIAKRALFPLETCIIFERKQQVLIESMESDAAYLHAMAFGTQSFFNWALGRKSLASTQAAFFHFIKALQLLRERLQLDDEEAKISNSTINVILTLAMYAHVIGEHEAAKNHMIGLRKIINIRGGITTFKENIKLLIELLRCDIRMVLTNGENPFFFNNPFLEPFIPYPDLIIPQHPPNESLNNICEELVEVWAAAKGFCSLVNIAAENGYKLPEEILLNTMASITYRLLYMRFEISSLDEVIRLGLLAFASNIFLQWQDVRPTYDHFYATYKDCLLHHRSLDDISPPLLLWLLIVGSISVFKESDDVWVEPWLRLSIETNEASRWCEARCHLDSIMWIGMIHDKPGEIAFDAVSLHD
ncbi:hypothetical protein F5884DRAFT_788896 [Xylogone sp. PMI_703]|nr:hypothetical protein F5884DRAFT_788896 [Xylogone sp. PMI_703]